ncbi:HalX domain-containing protein [Natrinema sp. DC36]|uniref:HalX domain-containing protein n=1 Tax=Natrinema sp. DC36 TaxID=2878680 RepID=UPI001CEFDCC8|nr:HalX domain-containing protein [Natrinema sp. DC36]
MAGDTNTVLVADDDPIVVRKLRSWLADEYRVETTTHGDETLSLFEDADAVLVGHDLRTDSGTVVAAEIECRTTAQTIAVLCDGQGGSPLPAVGDSLEKPVQKTALLETADRLVRRARYEELVAECATLAAERGAIESRGDVDSNEEYETLQRRLDEVFAELDELVSTFDGDDFRAAFATCEFGTPAQPQSASEHP